MRDEAHYACGLEGYEHWNAVENYKAKKHENEKAWKDWEQNSKSKREDGVEEKKTAVAKLTIEFEKAEELLIKMGGKTFREMYPESAKLSRRLSHTCEPPAAVPYDTSLTFTVPELNDIKRAGYIRLFNAAWENDLEAIKSLTLGPWQSDDPSAQAPLQVAVTDGNGFSPFSIAVLRGHRELARKIIEICMTQYHKDDGVCSRHRWTTRKTRSDDDDMSVDYDDEEKGVSMIESETVPSLTYVRSFHFCRAVSDEKLRLPASTFTILCFF